MELSGPCTAGRDNLRCPPVRGEIEEMGEWRDVHETTMQCREKIE